MLTRRDLIVAASTIGITCSVLAAVDQRASLIGSSTYDWNHLQPTKTSVGEVRQVFRGPTATLDELEMHITTLNPGMASHPPHQHPNEELIILRTGTVETLSNGVWTRLGAGSVIFNASNQWHSLRNVGDEPATYHVINWKSPSTPPPASSH